MAGPRLTKATLQLRLKLKSRRLNLTSSTLLTELKVEAIMITTVADNLVPVVAEVDPAVTNNNLITIKTLAIAKTITAKEEVEKISNLNSTRRRMKVEAIARSRLLQKSSQR